MKKVLKQDVIETVVAKIKELQKNPPLHQFNALHEILDAVKKLKPIDEKKPNIYKEKYDRLKKQDIPLPILAKAAMLEAVRLLATYPKNVVSDMVSVLIKQSLRDGQAPRRCYIEPFSGDPFFVWKSYRILCSIQDMFVRSGSALEGSSKVGELKTRMDGPFHQAVNRFVWSKNNYKHKMIQLERLLLEEEANEKVRNVLDGKTDEQIVSLVQQILGKEKIKVNGPIKVYKLPVSNFDELCDLAEDFPSTEKTLETEEKEQ
ncbi:hypothetical protein H6775_03720 [Candidatus Nomurabacteria bacterium]|nr:hypothetical protein [Candidatus Nomurabacteria bacterium]